MTSRAVVLVVDDDPDIREIVSEILEDAGYHVISAANGAEALECLKTQTPSLILLDLYMPVMDGFEFRRRQKESSAAGIPTVVVSAVHYLKERVAALGFADALTKPVEFRHLLDVVKRHAPS